MVAEPWSLDPIDARGGHVYARGWSLPAISARGEVEPREFRLNGRRFSDISYTMPRPDVGAFFSLRPLGEMSGFECRDDSGDEPFPGGVMEIERVRPGSMALDRGRDSWFVPDPALHADLPDEERRFRVIGNREAYGFLATGATDYYRLDRLIAAVSGRRLHEFERVLDWGVGCGRVARHFPRHRAAAFAGCDIDHDNVDWCSRHLDGMFVRSSLVPPLPFPSNHFSAIYGVSIFTHFREELQLQWLAELARIAATGAFVLVTVHGRMALEWGQSAAEYALLREVIDRAGVWVSGSNKQLDGHADHRGEYVNTFHSHDYIRRVWSRFFDVIAIVPGYIYTHDLVVLRKADSA